MPQFLHDDSVSFMMAGITTSAWMGSDVFCPDTLDLLVSDFAADRFEVGCDFLGNRLLNAGHPLHPSAPPVPSHRPPPGHDPGFELQDVLGALVGRILLAAEDSLRGDSFGC